MCGAFFSHGGMHLFFFSNSNVVGLEYVLDLLHLLRRRIIDVRRRFSPVFSRSVLAERIVSSLFALSECGGWRRREPVARSSGLQNVGSMLGGSM